MSANLWYAAAALSFSLPVNNDPIRSAITASRPVDRSFSQSVAVFTFHDDSSLPSAAPDALRLIRICPF